MVRHRRDRDVTSANGLREQSKQTRTNKQTRSPLAAAACGHVKTRPHDKNCRRITAEYPSVYTGGNSIPRNLTGIGKNKFL